MRPDDPKFWDDLEVDSQELRTWTGLTDKTHRQLADEGCYAKPNDGWYLLKPFVQGIVRHYRELTHRRGQLKDKIDREKLRGLKLKHDEAGGLLVARQAVIESLTTSLIQIREILKKDYEEEMPLEMSGMGVAENRILGKRRFDRVCEKIQAVFREWK